MNIFNYNNVSSMPDFQPAPVKPKESTGFLAKFSVKQIIAGTLAVGTVIATAYIASKFMVRAEEITQAFPVGLYPQPQCLRYQAPPALSKATSALSIFTHQTTAAIHKPQETINLRSYTSPLEQKINTSKEIPSTKRMGDLVPSIRIDSNLLDPSLFDRAKLYIDNNFDGENPIGGLGGHTPIFLPRNLSVVIKSEQNSEVSSLRAKKMEEAQNICRSNGYTHLTVPNASPYKKFNIETRLPIGSTDIKRQIELYTRCPERFTKAIKELTNFLCQTTLSDLIGGKFDFNGLSKDEFPRYDNAVLYLDEEHNQMKGRIGLVDLDGFEARHPSISQLESVIRLFPLHYNDIIQEAKIFWPTLEADSFAYARDSALNFINRIYLNHVNFLKSNGITPENPNKFAPLPISLERKLEIQHVIANKLTEIWGTKDNIQLLDNGVETMKNIQRIIPHLLDIVTAYFEDIILPSKKHPLNYLDLVESRTLTFNSLFINEELMSKTILSKFSILNELKEQENILDIDWLVFFLTDKLFEELARGGEVVNYERRTEFTKDMYREYIVLW